MREAARPRVAPGPQALAARKRFGRYRKEEGKAQREAQRTGAIKAFAPLWDSIALIEDEDRRFDNIDKEFLKVIRTFGDIRFTAAQIEEISAMLHLLEPESDEGGYTSDKVGLFLSAAIETSPDKEFLIRTADLRRDPNFLGAFNRKFVSIEGDAGAFAGHRMRGGLMRISGNAGLAADCMERGVMIIDGDALEILGNSMSEGIVIVKGSFRGITRPDGEQVGEDLSGGDIVIMGHVRAESIGCRMSGGSIAVRGDADANIGPEMTGGEILIGGAISLDGIPTTDLTETADWVKGGKIFHKKKLIVEK